MKSPQQKEQSMVYSSRIYRKDHKDDENEKFSHISESNLSRISIRETIKIGDKSVRFENYAQFSPVLQKINPSDDEPEEESDYLESQKEDDTSEKLSNFDRETSYIDELNYIYYRETT